MVQLTSPSALNVKTQNSSNMARSIVTLVSVSVLLETMSSVVFFLHTY